MVGFDQVSNKRRPVSLKFSIKGVKIYDEDETVRMVFFASAHTDRWFWKHLTVALVCYCDACLQTLLMAHALRRVSLSTSRPSDAQFAFVSHNPGSLDAQLYCHVFQARHARAVRKWL